MKLTSLELITFRNYDQARIIFAAHKNYFIGKNAQGKSNLLEAIYLLCLSKSFRTTHEKEAIGFSKQDFIIKGKFNADNGNIQKVVFHYSKEKGKQISVNRKRLTKISEFIGNLPIVLSSPEEYNLTTGPPQERRKFINILLSQISKKYIFSLVEYNRILKQKNAILLKWKLNGTQKPSILEPWNDRLIEIGSKIIQFRDQFSKLLSTNIGEIYSEFVVNNEKLKFQYKPNLEFKHVDDIADNFRNKLTAISYKEIQRGTSLVGPHRDDFVFKINDHDLKKFGSRGQHKTVLISLAIAEYNLIKQQTNENPIILIDDLYSEIDEDREKRILDLLDGLGQVFITSTEVHDNNKGDSNNKYYFINEGTINQR